MNTASDAELALLDLRRPFTRSEVAEAFREKSFKAHPDQGDDSDFFRALVLARDICLREANPDLMPSGDPDSASPDSELRRSARTDNPDDLASFLDGIAKVDPYGRGVCLALRRRYLERIVAHENKAWKTEARKLLVSMPARMPDEPTQPA